MRIAIVDDDEKDLGHLRDEVETYTETRNIDTEIDTFSSGSDFLQAFRPGKYQLIFFDNYIGNGLGIDFARAVRRQDEEAEFVFVSMSPEFAVSGFEVRALHYLLKPAAPEDIAKVFSRFWNHTQKQDEPMIEVMSGYHPVLIPIRSIRYIEIINKTCCIHGEQTIQTNSQLKKLMELLPPDEIVRTHSSFAVRLSCIRAMEKNEFIMDDGKTIPIGRAYYNCKSAYIEYLTNKRIKRQ